MNLIPLKIGTDAEFCALREALISCGYNESAVCERFGVQRISELRIEGALQPLEDQSSDPVRLLSWLFIDGRSLDVAALESLPTRELDSLGLLTRNDAKVSAAAMLYPVRGLYIASDRSRPIEGDDSPPPEDIVYSAIVPNSELFVDLIPKTACDAFLDLCAGTGIAALAAAKNGAKYAWSCDLTERSTHFAEFNRRLNAIPNVTAVQGDLWDAVPGLTFDRIVAHPPYLPVYRPRFVFDSGGQDGEQIVQRIIEGLPQYLRPGGRFYALTMGSDREQHFEQRLRGWLGEAEGEFDIALVIRRTTDPTEYAANAVVGHHGEISDISSWRQLFRQWNVQSLVYGLVVIQRRNHERPVFTVRRQISKRTMPAEHEWLIEWETAALHAKHFLKDAKQFLSSHPRARPNVKLQVDHRFQDGQWRPESYRFENEYPFLTKMGTLPWAAHLLTRADGSLTIDQLLDQLKADGALDASTEPAEFVDAVVVMISSGWIEIDEFRLPAAE